MTKQRGAKQPDTKQSGINDNKHQWDIGAIIIDFDGTITTGGICDAIMAEFCMGWQEIGALHDAGDISHAELNRQFISILTETPETIHSFLKSKGPFIRKGFENFVRKALKSKTPVFIVSGGWDFYILDVLALETGLKNFSVLPHIETFSPQNLNIVCNRITYADNRWTIEKSMPAAFKSSPCKKTVIDHIRNHVSGKIVFIGDGSTDFLAADEADIVFARSDLATYCGQNGIPFHPYHDFEEIDAALLKLKAAYGDYSALLKTMRSRFFLDPTGKNIHLINQTLISSLSAGISGQGDGPLYTQLNKALTPLQSIQGASMNTQTTTQPQRLLHDLLPSSLQGGVKGGHPFVVKNIIPTPSTVFLSAWLVASLYAQNGVTGEDAAEALNSELKVAAVMAELAGFDRNQAAGLFTFGGTGTNMYGIKMGLAKCCPHHAKDGIKEPVYVIGSKPAHYCHVTAADWLGIGQKSYIHVRSHTDQSTDLADLEAHCRRILDMGGKLACIMGVAGTTSNMAIDDFGAIKTIRDTLVRDYGLDYSPHIHADAVVGWPYLFFRNYDFKDNRLGFTPNTRERIEKAMQKISTIQQADSFGIDFHKTGYMPYNTSMVICKNKADLQRLGRDMDLMTPLFHDDAVYNPGKVSLETSRSSATMLATWLTLQAFGHEGYQVLLGHAQEMASIARHEISTHKKTGLYVANRDGYGTDIFVRCYPPDGDPETKYIKELNNDDDLAAHSDYTSRFFKWLTQSDNSYKDKLAISKTSAAFYTPSGKPFIALRIYILSPYTTAETIKMLVDTLAQAKNAYDESIGLNNHANKKITAPL